MPESKQPQYVTVAGTGTVWVAPEATAIPTGITAPIAPWTDVGYISEDGATISISREQEEIMAWQSADPVRVLITAEPKTITFELLEFDRQALSLALQGGTWSGTAPFTYTPPAPGTSAVKAMMIDAVDSGKTARFIFPRVQLSGDVEWAMVRTDAIRLPLEFSVLASTPSWSIAGDLPGFDVAGATREADETKAKKAA